MPGIRHPHVLVLLAAVSALVAGPAPANERHFTYTYETAVLPPGGRELEIWTTPRIGREDFHIRFDQRMEFEVGLTERLMTAFYLNASATNTKVTPGVREHDWEFEGVSSEWKLKLSDPVADRVGFALYGEATGGPNASEIEAKVILDKRMGKLLVAANLVGANEWDYTGPDTDTEGELELDLGATWHVRPGFSMGLEMRNHNEFVDGEWEHSALFAGPVFSYATGEWWVAATILPQLPAPRKEEKGGDPRILDEHEKLNARLLFSFHL